MAETGAPRDLRLQPDDLARLVLSCGETESLDFKARPPRVSARGEFHDEAEAPKFVKDILSLAAAQRQHPDRPSRLVYGVELGGDHGRRECWSVDRPYYAKEEMNGRIESALRQAQHVSDPRTEPEIRKAALDAELRCLDDIALVWSDEEVAQRALEAISGKWFRPSLTLAYHVHPAPKGLNRMIRPNGDRGGLQIGVITIDAEHLGGTGEISCVAKACGTLRKGDYWLRRGQHNTPLRGARLRSFIEDDFRRRVFRSLNGASVVLACGAAIVLYMMMQAILTMALHMLRVFNWEASRAGLTPEALRDFVEEGQIRLVGLYLLAIIGNTAICFTTCLWAKKLPRDRALLGTALIVPAGVVVAIVCWAVSTCMDLDWPWVWCVFGPGIVFAIGGAYFVFVAGHESRIKRFLARR